MLRVAPSALGRSPPRPLLARHRLQAVALPWLEHTLLELSAALAAVSVRQASGPLAALARQASGLARSAAQVQPARLWSFPRARNPRPRGPTSCLPAPSSPIP